MNKIKKVKYIIKSLFIMFCLLFIKDEYSESEGDVLTLDQKTKVRFKKFRGNIYVIESWPK